MQPDEQQGVPLPQPAPQETQAPPQQPLAAQPIQQQPVQPQPVQAPQQPTPQPQPATEPASNTLSWQASESIQHDKSGLWFIALFLIAAALLAIDYFFIKSWTFAVLIVVMTIGTFVVVRRQPALVNYSLSPQTLQVDGKQFSLHDFKAFGVLQEGAMWSVQLLPVKRFMPSVNVYFPPEYGEQVVDVLGSALPMEKIEPDLIDKLSQKIHF